jgi:hypothetical protein
MMAKFMLEQFIREQFTQEQFIQERFSAEFFGATTIADEVALPWGERKATGMISNGLAHTSRVRRRHGSSSQAR